MKIHCLFTSLSLLLSFTATLPVAGQDEMTPVPATTEEAVALVDAAPESEQVLLIFALLPVVSSEVQYDLLATFFSPVEEVPQAIGYGALTIHGAGHEVPTYKPVAIPVREAGSEGPAFQPEVEVRGYTVHGAGHEVPTYKPAAAVAGGFEGAPVPPVIETDALTVHSAGHEVPTYKPVAVAASGPFVPEQVEGGVSFITVHGAGHEVPTYKPVVE